jgi:hypothetical protein
LIDQSEIVVRIFVATVALQDDPIVLCRFVEVPLGMSAEARRQRIGTSELLVQDDGSNPNHGDGEYVADTPPLPIRGGN